MADQNETQGMDIGEDDDEPTPPPPDPPTQVLDPEPDPEPEAEPNNIAENDDEPLIDSSNELKQKSQPILSLQESNPTNISIEPETVNNPNDDDNDSGDDIDFNKEDNDAKMDNETPQNGHNAAQATVLVIESNEAIIIPAETPNTAETPETPETPTKETLVISNTENETQTPNTAEVQFDPTHIHAPGPDGDGDDDDGTFNPTQLSPAPDALRKTESTDAVEAAAAMQLASATDLNKLEQVSTLTKLGKSIFENEGKWAFYWLLYTAIYWTPIVWIPTLIRFSFATPGMIAWCFGFIGLCASFYALYEGKYPSGALKTDPSYTKSIGRWTAFSLTAVVIIDLCVLSFMGMLTELTIDQKVRGSFHLFHIFWATCFFYGKFRRANPEIANTAFWLEWFDILMSCIVIVILHNTLNDDIDKGGDEDCFDQAICIVYFVFVCVELIGWCFPMMILENWGTSEDGKIVSAHLFFLDITADTMVFLAVLYEESYKKHPIIMIDVIWKTMTVIRSCSYYLVYVLWLGEGKDKIKNCCSCCKKKK